MTLVASLPLAPAGVAANVGTWALAPRFFLYSHDGSGLGHLRRNLNLAAALVDACPAASVLLATGSEALDAFVVPPSVDVLRLPGLRKVGHDRDAARRLALDDDEVRRLRAALLTTAVETFRPEVVVADKHPAGVHGELAPALQALRAGGGRAAFGLRDVLDGAARAQRGLARRRAGRRPAPPRHGPRVRRAGTARPARRQRSRRSVGPGGPLLRLRRGRAH